MIPYYYFLLKACPHLDRRTEDESFGSLTAGGGEGEEGAGVRCLDGDCCCCRCSCCCCTSGMVAMAGWKAIPAPPGHMLTAAAAAFAGCMACGRPYRKGCGAMTPVPMDAIPWRGRSVWDMRRDRPIAWRRVSGAAAPGGTAPGGAPPVAAAMAASAAKFPDDLDQYFLLKKFLMTFYWSTQTQVR